MNQNKVETHDAIVVLISGWEMQCCGTPFSVGDYIKWLASKWGEGYIAPEGVVKIDYCYDEHSSDWQKLFTIAGKVVEIRATYEKFVPNPDNGKYLMRAAGETEIKKTTYADGWDKDIDGKNFDCYVVNLEDVSISSAKQSEVTFQ